MDFSAIEGLLLEAMGLDSESIGNNTVQRIVQKRMDEVGIELAGDYLVKIKKDPVELQELIDAVTVPETWFFRDKNPFILLTEVVRREWFPPSRGRLLRILSIPCATGEEPYSIAMVLKDMGFNAETVRVDAVDISIRALGRARRAVYGPNSFRGDEGNYRSRYFNKSDDGYVLNDSIKQMVNLQHENLLNSKYLAGSELYDVVFCRNVLIYFRREQQDVAVKKLYRILAANGLLFVGHAEGGRLPNELFASMKQSGTFAFRKRTSVVRDTDPAVDKLDVPLKKHEPLTHLPQQSMVNSGSGGAEKKNLSGDTTVAVKSAVQAAKQQSKSDGNSLTSHDGDVSLAEVRRLADKGELSVAAESCEQFLLKNTVSAEAYYLLGLIRQAEGKDSFAGELFRKAVYLDPRHYQALVHLAAQAELLGNWAAAAVYRSRASRVMDKDK